MKLIEKSAISTKAGMIQPAVTNFFLGARLDQYREKCNHYRLIVACMLSGASRDRPVIVGWSTALRGQVINESLGQLPKKLAAGTRLLARTESSRSESGTKQGGPPHDHWAKLMVPTQSSSAIQPIGCPILAGECRDCATD